MTNRINTLKQRAAELKNRLNDLENYVSNITPEILSDPNRDVFLHGLREEYRAEIERPGALVGLRFEIMLETGTTSMGYLEGLSSERDRYTINCCRQLIRHARVRNNPKLEDLILAYLRTRFGFRFQAADPYILDMLGLVFEPINWSDIDLDDIEPEGQYIGNLQ